MASGDYKKRSLKSFIVGKNLRLFQTEDNILSAEATVSNSLVTSNLSGYYIQKDNNKINYKVGFDLDFQNFLNSSISSSKNDVFYDFDHIKFNKDSEILQYNDKCYILNYNQYTDKKYNLRYNDNIDLMKSLSSYISNNYNVNCFDDSLYIENKSVPIYDLNYNTLKNVTFLKFEDINNVISGGVINNENELENYSLSSVLTEIYKKRNSLYPKKSLSDSEISNNIKNIITKILFNSESYVFDSNIYDSIFIERLISEISDIISVDEDDSTISNDNNGDFEILNSASDVEDDSKILNDDNKNEYSDILNKLFNVLFSNLSKESFFRFFNIVGSINYVSSLSNETRDLNQFLYHFDLNANPSSYLKINYLSLKNFYDPEYFHDYQLSSMTVSNELKHNEFECNAIDNLYNKIYKNDIINPLISFFSENNFYENKGKFIRDNDLFNDFYQFLIEEFPGYNTNENYQYLYNFVYFNTDVSNSHFDVIFKRYIAKKYGIFDIFTDQFLIKYTIDANETNFQSLYDEFTAYVEKFIINSLEYIIADLRCDFINNFDNESIFNKIDGNSIIDNIKLNSNPNNISSYFNNNLPSLQKAFENYVTYFDNTLKYFSNEEHKNKFISIGEYFTILNNLTQCNLLDGSHDNFILTNSSNLPLYKNGIYYDETKKILNNISNINLVNNTNLLASSNYDGMIKKESDYLNVFNALYEKENYHNTISGNLLGCRKYENCFKNSLNDLYLVYNYDTSDSLEFKNEYFKEISSCLSASYLIENLDELPQYKNMLKSIKNIQFVERFKGEYFYKTMDKTKSNVYSLKIKNSKLSDLHTDSNNIKDLKKKIRASFEEVIRNSIHRYMPANTTLWKIEYID